MLLFRITDARPWRALLLITLTWLHLALQAAPAAPSELKLRLLETSDLHMNLLAYDYYQDRPSAELGLAATAALIRTARAEQPNVLLLDNGDLLQGSPMGDWAARLRPHAAGEPHPAFKLMNRLGYDAANLGNHDFDYGLPWLRQALAGARFPYLNANLIDTATGRPAFRPSLILTRRFIDSDGRPQRLRIGLIGVAPPQIPQWSRAVLGQRLRAVDMVEATRQQITRLRAARVDLIIVIAHCGLEREAQPDGAENRAAELARLPGVDALLLGHAHQAFPGPAYQGYPGADLAAGRLHGVPTVMSGRWGDHLGLIDLHLQRQAGRWRVLNSRSELRPIYERKAARATVAAEAWVGALLAHEHQQTLQYVRRELARSEAPLHSYFARVMPAAPVQWVARAQLQAARESLRGTRWEGLPLLAAAAPFKTGGRDGWNAFTDIPPGPLAIKHVADLYPYPNTLKLLHIRGAQLREWLERSAAQFRHIDPAGAPEQALIDENQPSFNFDVIEGLSYEIDVSQPARYDGDGRLLDAQASRIRSLRYAGLPLQDEQEFVLATNSYRASGGGRFPGVSGLAPLPDSGEENRELLTRFLTEQRVLAGDATPNWRVLPVPGVRLVFRSSILAERQINAATPVRFLHADDEPGAAWYELLPN